jgi:hypothetical protein
VSEFGVRSAEEVLDTIGRLSAEDRQWILTHLPPQARSRLAALTNGPPRPGDSASAESVGILRTCSSGRIVAALGGEPAWVIHSVVFAQDWPWRKDVLQRLPATLRVEVSSLERARTRLAPAAREFLLRALAQRIGTGVGEESAIDSRFESLLRRFGRGGAGQ